MSAWPGLLGTWALEKWEATRLRTDLALPTYRTRPEVSRNRYTPGWSGRDRRCSSRLAPASSRVGASVVAMARPRIGGARPAGSQVVPSVCQASAWMRVRMLAAVLVVAAVTLPAGAVAAGSGGGRVCGFIHARVPYSTRGGGPVWRIYSRGAVSCREAATVLGAVLHLHAKNHSNGSEANSYFTDGEWTCPYGQMGVQTCALGPTRHPRAEAFALRCSENQCPAHRVPDV